MEVKEFKVCSSISTVFSELKSTHFCLEKISKEAKQNLEQIARFYKISEDEAIVLILSIEEVFRPDEDDIYDSQEVIFNCLCKLVNCDPLKIIPYKKQAELLCEKNYFKREWTSLNLTYEISSDVMEALHTNCFEGIINIEPNLYDRYDFVKTAANIYEGRLESKKQSKVRALINLEKNFMNLEYVKKINNLVNDQFDRFIFYDCCQDFIKGTKSHMLITLKDIYMEKDVKREVEKLTNGTHGLIRADLLKVVKEERLEDAKLALTDKAKDIFLGEDLFLYERQFSAKDMITTDKINEVRLFYSESNKKQIETLTDYLSRDHLEKIQRSLKEKGMKTGFAVLFHGAPGTGKTETVYQLAKMTDRGIIKVDISNSKSCWFGESEKIIKDIFDQYRTTCQNARYHSENIPILLFNEADAIFSKRKDSTAGSVAQTENAIQNIILDEMENLDGILIATTNLTDNFDKAFERRFLYKIKFDNPTPVLRKEIWKSRTEDLSEENLNKLSEFELSGGQIDNIMRKATMNEILTEQKPDYNSLASLCAEEHLDSGKTRRMGFAV